MDLSPELRLRLDKLVAERDNYAYEGDLLQDKTFVAIIAPTAVGKTTLTNACLHECRTRGVGAGVGDTLTTRERRAGDDPPNYVTANEGITFDSMITRIENHEMVNWSMHGTGHLYGSTPQAMVHKYVIAPIMADSLPMMRRAGFANVIAIYLAISVDQWKIQLGERLDDPMFAGRMQEAMTSLEYAKAHESELILLNIEHGEEPVRQKAVTIVDHIVDGAPLPSDSTAPGLIDEMLSFARGVVDGNA